MAGWRYLDDLISAIGRQSMPRPRNVFYVDPQGVARTESQDFLQRMAELAQAEDLARGSTMALRARNAERGFLDQLGDADLPAGRQFTPRDVARLRTDEARRDARMGPFAPDDLNANAWDWRRTVERNLAEARAAQIASDQARNQFLGTTAASAGVGTAIGTAALATTPPDADNNFQPVSAQETPDAPHGPIEPAPQNAASVNQTPNRRADEMTPQELEYKYRNRMSLSPEERAEVERLYEARRAAASADWGASPTSLDPVEAAAMDIPDDPDAMERANAGLFANLPERQMGALDAEVPTLPIEDDGISEEEVDARVRMVQQRGASNMFTPETQRAVARAALEYPVDPMSGDYSTPQFRAAVREAIARENQAKAAAKAQAEEEANAPYEADARQRANIQRLIRAGVNPMQDMTAPTAEQQDKFDNWARSGSMERMARYAPAEAQRRWDEGVAQRHAEYVREQSDPEYKARKRAAEARTLEKQTPAANNALRRELQQLGIDTDQFEGNTQTRMLANQEFDRAGAYAAKQKALNSQKVGARDAVIRRAQLRQNPMEYLGRSDITDDQRMQASLALAGGRGATPNDVRALQEKRFMEGIEAGARSNMNIGNRDMAQQLAIYQLQQQNRAAAEQAAQTFFDERKTGYYSPALDQQAYDDLIALLGSYNLTPQQAAGIASRYRRAPTRAEKTQPKEG